MALGQAQDHYFDQSLLDRLRYLWLSENVGSGLRKMARRFVQLLHEIDRYPLDALRAGPLHKN